MPGFRRITGISQIQVLKSGPLIRVDERASFLYSHRSKHIISRESFDYHIPGVSFQVIAHRHYILNHRLPIFHEPHPQPLDE